MDQPSEGLQWAVHAADRKGWEVRLTYYEQLLRSVMEMLDASIDHDRCAVRSHRATYGFGRVVRTSGRAI
jgi:hypothetical protein